MSLLQLGLLYVAAGSVLAWRFTRAQPVTLADRALTVLAWPLYLPMLLAPATPATSRVAPGDPVQKTFDALTEALDGVSDRPLAASLPTREHLRRLTDHVRSLDQRVHELDALLERPEFDPMRARRAVEEAVQSGVGSQVARARDALDSVDRLVALRDRTVRDRDELLGLCERLRLRLTVFRYEGGTREDVGALVAEILGRVEGVGVVLAATGPLHSPSVLP